MFIYLLAFIAAGVTTEYSFKKFVEESKISNSHVPRISLVTVVFCWYLSFACATSYFLSSWDGLDSFVFVMLILIGLPASFVIALRSYKKMKESDQHSMLFWLSVGYCFLPVYLSMIRAYLAIHERILMLFH